MTHLVDLVVQGWRQGLVEAIYDEVTFFCLRLFVGDMFLKGGWIDPAHDCCH